MSLNKNLAKNLANVKNLQGKLLDKGAKKILSSKLGSKLLQLNPAVKTINIGITLFKLVALFVFVILAAISYNKSKSSSTSLGKTLNIISIVVLIMSCLTLVLRKITNGSLKVGVIYYLIYISLIVTGFIMSTENEKKVPDNEKDKAAHVRRSYNGLLVMVIIFICISILVSITPFRSILLDKVFFTPGL
jgi:hypothetical protein